MKTLVKNSLQIKPLFVLMTLLFIGTSGFSQTPKALRAFVVDSKSYGDITLSMNDLNGNTNVTIFIEKSINGGAFSVIGSFISQPSQPNPTYIAVGLSASTPYCFRARARNSGGVYSEYSQEACATTNALPVPSGLTATETGPNNVRLNWSGYGGKDSGIKVAIERSTGAGGAFTQIGTAEGERGTFTDNSGLSPATRYCYRIRGIWGAAGNSDYSNTACATTQQTAPAAPSGLIAQSLDPTFQIQLNWIDGSGNETGFVIERGTNGVNFSQIATVGANVTQYNNTGLPASTRYYYRVRAFNDAGSSGYTNVADATTNPGPPAAPGNLSATTVSDSQLNLNWTDNSGNESGFEIERSQDGTNFSKIAEVGGNTTSYSSDGLNANTQYWYRIRAKNNGGNSAYSNVANATTRDVAPNTPQSLSATPVSNTQINLNWTDNSGNETGFEVERSTDGTNFSKIADLGANTTSYQNTGLSTLTRYWYRVRAKNAIGNSGYSNIADVTTFDVPPIAPSNLTATTASGSQINLAWTDNSGNETGFEIERSTDGTNFGKVGDAGVNATVFQDTGLTPNKKHWYRVRSRNSQGASEPTNVATSTTHDVAPAAPQNLSAAPITNKQIDLRWTDITGAFGLETSYEVERSSDGTIFTRIADVVANATIYQSIGLSTLTKYWYRIRAKNAIGYSPYSNIAETTTFDVPPISPTDLTATTASSSQINLVWKDNSSNESAFDVERSTDGTSFSKVGEAAANTNAFQNTGLTPATKYWYRVRSRNSQGASDPTNVATATTRDVLPSNPSNLVASVIDYFSVKLDWSDNSGNERNFTIERSTDGSNFVSVDSVGRNISRFSNKGLKDETTYYFRVRALNAIGYSGYSNVAVVTTPKAPLPAKPENLKVTAIDFDLVRLTWDAVSPNTKTVVIERSENPDKNFAEIGRTPYPGRVFDDREILDVIDHYYRIKAINDAGLSPYSDVVKLSAKAIITGTEPAAEGDLAYVYGKILYLRLDRPRLGRLLLYDMRGVVIKNVKLSQTMEIDLKTIGPGIYIAVIDSNQKVIRRKLLIH